VRNSFNVLDNRLFIADEGDKTERSGQVEEVGLGFRKITPSMLDDIRKAASQGLILTAPDDT
jgi:hypothetical protein